VIIISIIPAVKIFVEPNFTSACYIKVMLVSIKELHMMAIDFLFRINFQRGIETSLNGTCNERLVLQFE